LCTEQWASEAVGHVRIAINLFMSNAQRPSISL
jgi:hypothetical protein